MMYDMNATYIFMDLKEQFCKYLPDILDENIGKMYGVTRSTISYIVNNKTFKHLLEN